MTIRDLLAEASSRLARAGVDDPRRDARILLAAALGVDQAALLARDDRTPAPDAAARFAAMIARRARREPVARVLGKRGFWTLNLAVTADTLDPRPDSETLVEAVLDSVADRAAALRLLDLGTGTGCLLLALLSELPNATGIGVDRAPGAVRTARTNARDVGLERRTGFLVGDWSQALSARFDVVVSNPPYIERAVIATLAPEVRDYDPPAALDGGPDGLDAYRAILGDVRRLLAPGGLVALELGQGQDASVAALIRGIGMTVRSVRADLAGIGRCIIATDG